MKRYLDPDEFIRQRFAEREAPDWPLAVICFRDVASSVKLADRLGAKPLRRRIISGTDSPGERPWVYEGKVGGTNIGLVAGCWWGGPQAAVIAEELASLGVEYILGYGAAGTISKDLPKYSQVAAVSGLVTDGTSRAYTTSEKVDADSGLVKMMEVVSPAVLPVTVATVDALYMETPAAVKQWAGLGAQAVNMETTPLYAVAQTRKIKSLWLGLITDSVTGDDWDPWWGIPEEANEETVEIIAALIENVLGGRK